MGNELFKATLVSGNAPFQSQRKSATDQLRQQISSSIFAKGGKSSALDPNSLFKSVERDEKQQHQGFNLFG